MDQEVLKFIGEHWHIVTLALVTFVEVLPPIKINPWSALFTWIGKKFTATLSAKVAALEASQKQMQTTLQNDITDLAKQVNKNKDDDEKERADNRRTRILRFSNELLREIPHTKEEFIECLADIDAYEDYCDTHEHYENSRAELAIENIRDIYKHLLRTRGFLPDTLSQIKQEEEEKHD